MWAPFVKVWWTRARTWTSVDMIKTQLLLKCLRLNLGFFVLIYSCRILFSPPKSKTYSYRLLSLSNIMGFSLMARSKVSAETTTPFLEIMLQTDVTWAYSNGFLILGWTWFFPNHADLLLFLRSEHTVFK